MQPMMDIPGTAEALDVRNQRLLESARAIGLSADQARKLATMHYRAPRITRLKPTTDLQKAQARLTQLRRLR